MREGSSSSRGRAGRGSVDLSLILVFLGATLLLSCATEPPRLNGSGEAATVARASSSAGSAIIGADAQSLAPTLPPQSAPAEPLSRAQPRGLDAYRTFPVTFEPNMGQTDGAVKFLARGSGYTLFLAPTEAVLVLLKPSTRRNLDTSRPVKPDEADNPLETVLRMKLLGANPRPHIVGVQELPGKINYFIGDDPERWRTGIPTYANVKYQAVYPRIDLIYHGAQGRLEYDFVVAPGGDPNAIALEFQGADRLEVDGRGDLVVQVAGGELRLHKPYVYQEVGGARKAIGGAYALRSESRVGFQVAAYDVEKPLVIDPVLAYSTYLGGSGIDQALALAVDASGNAYVTGRTFSINFPTSSAPFQGTKSGKDSTSDVFVAKVNTNASGAASLVYSTYVGGSQDDVGYGIAVDGIGNAYVTGQTFSTASFPAKPLKSGTRGVADAFVFKLNPTGSALTYSVYLGGSSEDAGLSIAVDGFGSAYVTGFTSSSNFPTTPGAFDNTLGGGKDAFVTKLNPQGSALAYSTYLGGSLDDVGNSIALDAVANVYVTGYTASSNFPTTTGAFDGGFNGGRDVFVTKVKADNTGTAPDASDLLYSTLLGGSGDDFGNAIAVVGGNVYVTGSTRSTDFPTTSGALDPLCGTDGSCNGHTDAFVTQLNPAGLVVYSTYLGGNEDDVGNGIAVAAGNVYVTGFTRSAGFPVTTGALGYGGLADAFVTKIHPAGSGPADLVFSTHLGGSQDDIGHAIAVDASTNAYVAGETSSLDFPTVNAYSGPAGLTDAFVAKLGLDTPPALASPGNKVVNEGELLSFTLSATDVDAGQTITFSISGGLQSGMTLNASTGAFNWTPTEAQGPGTYGVTFRATDSLGAFDEKPITITVNEVNLPPSLADPGDKVIDALNLLSFTLSATDPDIPANTLTFSISSGSQPGMTLDAGSGAFSWTPANDQAHMAYQVTFQVTDNGNPPVSDQRTITITVNAPTLSGVPASVTINELVPYTFTATATDPGSGATLLFSLVGVGVPAGAVIDPVSGIFTWTPTEGQGPGTYAFKVRVMDDRGAFDEKPITITVNEVNTPPVLTVPGPLTFNEGDPVTFTVSATDADIPANALTLSLISPNPLPAGVTFIQDSSTTGTFAWTPNSAQGGPNPYFVQFQVSDGQLVDVKTVSITVNDTMADRDGDGIPDALDNCPDVPNPTQADVCHNSPETVDGTQNVTPPGVGGAIDVTFSTTITTGSTDTSFLPPGLFNVLCRVINNATGSEVPLGRIPEGEVTVLSTDPSVNGVLVTVPANQNASFSTTFDLRIFYPDLEEGSYTILCEYVNFTPLPDPALIDPPVWLGTAQAAPQTIFVGLYTFSGFISPLPGAHFGPNNVVPVKFQLRDSTGAFVTTATATLWWQQLDGAGNLIGSPVAATPSSGTGNLFRYDLTGNQYIYNMRAIPLPPGPIQLQVRLDDGTIQTTNVVREP